MVYNNTMVMQYGRTIETAVIGGGASGLFLATALSGTGVNVALFERGERVGKKLSATGNGQGNITNRAVKNTKYFSSAVDGVSLAKSCIEHYDDNSLCEFFHSLGLLVFFDERGRGYPTSRQASALTDALRFAVEKQDVDVHTDTQIISIVKRDKIFLLTDKNGKEYRAENVVLCTGGKAAKNFGTDGSAYDLARSFGHTLTKLYPSLVQLKTDTSTIRALKGIRVFDTRVTATWEEKGVKKEKTLCGDIIFTDYGVSGDAIFRLSAFISAQETATLTIDFLPDVSLETLLETLQNKRKAFPNIADSERLCGIVNNQVGRAVAKTVCRFDDKTLANAVKNFSLQVKGTLGFDYAQVTKGGIPLAEVDGDLQSRKIEGLYFAGEILDIDGECGGFNLQWAYSSARTVASAIAQKYEKRQG